MSSKFPLTMLIAGSLAACGPPAATPIDMAELNPEVGKMLDTAQSLARELLAKQGEFSPFGVTMSPDGTIGLQAGYAGEEQSSTDVIQLLEEAFRAGAQRGDYRATALVYDVFTTPPGKDARQDAIAVSVDHRDGDSAVVLYPYAFTAEGELTVEEPFAVEGKHKIFSP